jgi:hypothetical protein
MLQYISSYVKKSLRFLIEIDSNGTCLRAGSCGTEGDGAERMQLCSASRRWVSQPAGAGVVTARMPSCISQARETRGSLPGHAPYTPQTFPIHNFPAPGSASSLRWASPYPPVAPYLQTLRQAGFGPSWRNQCARMAQFREVAAKAGADEAVPYWVPSVSPAYLQRSAIRSLYST